MKQYIIYGLCLLAIFMYSCNEDSSNLIPSGTLRLHVDKNEVVLTKTTSAVTDQSLKVYIINAKEDTVKIYNDYLTEVQNEKLLLPVGTYTVAVSSNQTEEAGWEKPFYAGHETVEVKAGEITNATVTCKIANAKVTIAYSEGVKTNFTNYETKVSNSCGWLLYTRDEYRAGYFAPEKLVADLSLTNNDGKKFSIQRVLTDIKARYHYTITFKIGDKPDNPEGGQDFKITVNEDAKTIECEIVIDEDDLEGKKVPVIKLSDSFKSNQLTLKVGDALPSSSLTINSQVGIEMLTVKAESDLFQTAGVAFFDLTKLDANAIAQLDVLGFPLLPSEQDMKNITLDFDKLTANFLLDVALGKTKKIHKFTVYAMDKLHQETTITFTYEARPNVAVSTNEPNAFSTFAFLYGESAEASGHGFKYRMQGEAEYKTVTAQKVNADDGTFEAIITSLKPGTLYECIAISGEDSEGDMKTFTTEGSQAIENLNFDTWAKSGNNWYPNSSAADSYWATGNTGVTTTGTGVSESNSRPIEIIQDTQDENKTKRAVELKTISVNFAGAAAGNLFLGTFKVNMSDPASSPQFGRPYNSRPTKLSGYYKYSPQKAEYGSTPADLVMDMCEIYIWLKDASNKQIAYGSFSTDQLINDYTKFEIPIVYSDLNAKPTKITIVATSSKYGGLFNGIKVAGKLGIGSTLCIDNFSLSFDYDEKCFNAE